MASPFCLQPRASPSSSLPSHIWAISSLLQQTQSQPNAEMWTLRTGHKREASKCVFLAIVQDGTRLLRILVRSAEDHGHFGFLTSLTRLLVTIPCVCTELLTFLRSTPGPRLVFSLGPGTAQSGSRMVHRYPKQESIALYFCLQILLLSSGWAWRLPGALKKNED